MIRFIFFISPRGLGWFSKLDTLGDPRVYRTLSLLLLDALTITSAAKPTVLLVDFIPFAIGAVVVLGKHPPPQMFASANSTTISRVRLGTGKNREGGDSVDVVVLR